MPHPLCPLAQSVEHSAVNRSVVSSSLSGAANRKERGKNLSLFCCLPLRKELKPARSKCGKEGLERGHVSSYSSEAKNFAIASPVRGSQGKETAFAVPFFVFCRKVTCQKLKIRIDCVLSACYNDYTFVLKAADCFETRLDVVKQTSSSLL